MNSTAIHAILDYVDFRQQQFLRMLSKSMNSTILAVSNRVIVKPSDSPM